LVRLESTPGEGGGEAVLADTVAGPGADPTTYRPVVEEIEARLKKTTLWLKGEVAVGEDITSVAPASAREGLRMLNDRMNGLVERRKAELDQGTMESATRRQLSAFKPIVDQFNFIDKVSGNIERLSRELASGE
jgi:hypothetical protein